MPSAGVASAHVAPFTTELAFVNVATTASAVFDTPACSSTWRMSATIPGWAIMRFRWATVCMGGA